ncbi:ankyrin repeat domain-containing protein [Cardinium endosymbiont of Nabis limbatus]|uniref:ankyrin repeat domain-containing protein n=1 Tax=Cardinium endosymbiont of Nabis limbatus TaxID=3066217 RepID=UPI003AF33F73
MTKILIKPNRSTKLRNLSSQFGLILFLLIILQSFRLCNPNTKLGKSIIPSFESPQRLREDIDDSRNIGSIKDGTTWLHVAVRDAVESDKLEKLGIVLKRIKNDIDKGKDAQYRNQFPNSVDKTGWTPLGEAIKGGKVDLVRCLIDTGFIDKNKASKQLTSFLLALQKSQSKIAKYLLGCKEIDISTRDPKKGETPLHVAVRQGFGELVKTLAEKLIDQDKAGLLLIEDKSGMKPLHVAALYNNDYAFRVLFKKIRDLSPEKVYSLLVKQGDKAPSLFALAYSEPPASWDTFLNKLLKCVFPEEEDKIDDNVEMFKCVLDIVKDYLKSEDWGNILNEIQELESVKRLKPEYAKSLENIVEGVRFGSSKPKKSTDSPKKKQPNKSGHTDKEFGTQYK